MVGAVLGISIGRGAVCSLVLLGLAVLLYNQLISLVTGGLAGCCCSAVGNAFSAAWLGAELVWFLGVQAGISV